MYFYGADTIKIQVALQRVLADSNLIKLIIQRWELSEQYRQMIDGEKYYNCEHEISLKDFKHIAVYDEQLKDFITIENKNATTEIVVSPFLNYLNAQKANYIAGKRMQFVVKDSKKNTAAKKLEDEINNELNDYFESSIYDMVLHAANKGRECLIPFITEDGTFDYQIAPAQCIIPDYDKSTGKLISFMRYYDVDYLTDSFENDNAYVPGDGKIGTMGIGSSGSTILQQQRMQDGNTIYKSENILESDLLRIKRVEIWDSEKVSFFVQKDRNGEFIPDGVRSHFNYVNDTLQVASGAGWGRVPLVILNNNSEMQYDLLPIKHLIDAYDSVSTGFFQDVDAIQQVIVHINDYAGTDPTTIPLMLKLRKAISTSGPDGKVEAIQIQIPFDAKEKLLDRLRDSIYEFGRGIDVKKLAGGNNRIVEIEALFYGLYLKGNNTASQIKLALKDFIWFLLFYMQNKKTPGKVNIKELAKLVETVSVVIRYTKINNDTEFIANLVISVNNNLLSKKGARRLHPYIDDQELNEDELLEQESMISLDNVPPEQTNMPGDGNPANQDKNMPVDKQQMQQKQNMVVK